MVKTSISANTHETQVGGQHLQYRDNVILSPTRNKSYDLIVICN